MGAIAPGDRDEARYDYAAMSPATVTDATDAALAEAERLIEAVVSAPDPRTFDSTIRPLAAAAAVVWAADGVGSSIGYVHPDAAVRDAANAAEERTQKWRAGLARRDDLAAAILAYAGTDEAASLDGSRRQSVDLWLRDIRRAGHGLSPEQREEFAALNDRIADLCVAFGRNLGDWHDDMVLGEADLVGLPQTFVDRLPAGPEPGSRLLAAGYATTFAFIEQSPRRDLREIAIAKYYSRAAALNAPILAELVDARRRAASIVGADSWSQFANEARMSGGRAEVMAFLEGLIGPLQSLAAVEQAAMVEQLPADDPDAVLRASDWIYLHERQRESVGVDFERLAEYFPVDGLLERMIDLLGDVFGLVTAPLPDASVWHPDVRVFRIDDAATGEHLTDVYLDLFARDGKRPGGWMQSLRLPDNTPGRPRRPAVIQLVLNFAAPTGTGPTLLRHDDVAGLIHEFGHVLEFGLARTDGAMVTDSWTEIDFVEAPSQIMEHWAWSPAVVQRLGRHHATGEPPPDELVAGPARGPAAEHRHADAVLLHLPGPSRPVPARPGAGRRDGRVPAGVRGDRLPVHGGHVPAGDLRPHHGDLRRRVLQLHLGPGLRRRHVQRVPRRRAALARGRGAVPARGPRTQLGRAGPAAGRELPWPAAVGSGVPGAARHRRRVAAGPAMARGRSRRA